MREGGRRRAICSSDGHLFQEKREVARGMKWWRGLAVPLDSMVRLSSGSGLMG